MPELSQSQHKDALLIIATQESFAIYLMENIESLKIIEVKDKSKRRCSQPFFSPGVLLFYRMHKWEVVIKDGQ